MHSQWLFIAHRDVLCICNIRVLSWALLVLEANQLALFGNFLYYLSELTSFTHMISIHLRTHTHTHTHTRLQKTLVRLRVRKTVWLYAACTSLNVAPNGARPAAPLQNTWASTSSEISHINRSSVSRIMLNVLLCFFLVRGTVCNNIAFALN